MAKTYVSLDLETTGLDPVRDSIIEIGALRFEDDRVLETFSTFVNPGRKIPPFVTELTGITNKDVEDALPARVATRQLVDFVGRDPVIGHNIGFDLAFLRKHAALNGHPSVDTFEIAGVLVPNAGRYSLANLARVLHLDLPEQNHRALDDAIMAHALFWELQERASQLPQKLLEELVRLGQRIHWAPSRFFKNIQYRRSRQGFSGGIGAQLAARRGGDAAGPLFDEEEDIFDPLVPREKVRPIDLEALVGLLDDDGPIAEAFSEYEYREQQVEMLQAVAEAFNAGEHLFVEAGTGTGKSLAYLLPAVEWAVQNSQRVVISTNTINLQDQLASQDLPRLIESLYEFRFQVLKGRSHYLCRQQFEAMRRRGPYSLDEMRVLAKVLLWLPNTLDGDGDGLFLPMREEKAIWYMISAANEACNAEQCPFYQSDRCFFYRARERAEAAHIVVVNHALLLADVAMQNRVLPEYDLLIVDEAHHLERAATDSLRYTTNWAMLRRSFDELLRPYQNYPGLLDEVMDLSARLPRKITARLHDATIRLQDGSERTQRQLETFFNEVEVFLNEHVNGRNKYAERLRLTQAMRNESGWNNVILSWGHVEPKFAKLVAALTQLADGLEELTDVEATEMENVRVRLLSAMQRLAEAYKQLDAFINTPSENVIYWLEARMNFPFTFNSVPLHVGEMVQEHLFKMKRSIVLTSATLRIGGNFDYIFQRLGAENARELAVGSPFDFHSAALLAILSDIPEPRSTGYQKAVEETLLKLIQATEGRTLVLFTAYAQLQATARAVTGKLAQDGITVYAQGSGSSRGQLLESFRSGGKAALFGTRSFWEGVDIPGEALSCLVIVKLPFDVPNDPVVAARSEGYEDPFNEYMVPEAVLRFMQGFGRLIRTASDQGIAVVLDQRLLTKRYGTRFISSLPDPLVQRVSRTVLPEIAKRWLAGKPLPAALLSEVEGDGGELISSTEEPDWFWGA